MNCDNLSIIPNQEIQLSSESPKRQLDSIPKYIEGNLANSNKMFASCPKNWF
jgi:hypothetical protein